MRLKIAHVTHYQYDAPTPYGLQQLRLTPSPRPGLNVLNWTLSVDGARTEAEFRDHHDNVVRLTGMESDRVELTVRCEGEVETFDRAGVIGTHVGRAPLWFYLRQTEHTCAGERVARLVGELGGAADGSLASLHRLSAMILERVRYQPGETHWATNAEAALAGATGVCQDHAHIFIAAARRMNVPARYVSGYLAMEGPDDQDAGHAWAEAHVEGLGWVGFDVSNAISPDARYVAVATGLDAEEAAPIRGLMHARGDERMAVTLQIQEQ